MTHSSNAHPRALRIALCAVGLVSIQPLCAFANADVLITATRQESRVNEVLTDVTVIGRDRLDRFAGQSLVDVLAHEAGLQFARNGGPGALSSVFIRGGNSNQTLLLVDGVRQGNVFFSSPLLDDIPLESIERIEVLRGPASSLYGSDAIGGVIQVITRKGAYRYAKATVGSDQHNALSAGGGGQQGDLSYSLHVQRVAERTFSATRPGSFSFAADDDPFRLSNYNAKLAWALNADWSVEGVQSQSFSRVHLDTGDLRDMSGNFISAVDTRLRTRTNRSTLSLKGQVSDGWRTRLTASDTQNRMSLEQTPGFDGQNDGRQRQLTWQNDVSTAYGVASVALESLRQDIRSSGGRSGETSRDTDSILLGLTGGADQHGWQLQVRSDDISSFGRKNTGLVAYGYQLTPAFKLRAAHATAYRAPTFEDLFSPFGANPDLRPEEARNSEAGVDWKVAAHTVRLSAFRNRIDNLITLDSNFIPQNVDGKIAGVSLSDQVRWGAWQLQGRLEFVDPENARTGQQLARRSKEQGSVSLDYAADQWTAGGRWLARGSRFDDAANRNELPGYAVLDLHYTRKINADWKWSARVDNVFDRTYETVRFFLQPERRFFLTLAWEPRP